MELIPIVSRYGLEGISPDLNVMQDAEYAARADALRKEHGLKWGLYPMPANFFEATDIEFEEGLETLKRWGETLNRYQITRCYNHIPPSCDERQYDRNFDWHVKRLERLTRVTEDIGLDYGLECVGPTDAQRKKRFPFIHTAAGAFALINAAGSKAGIIYDAFHWYTGSNENLDDLYFVAQHVDRVVCLHVNDGIAGKSAAEQEDLTRAMPMTTGVIDSRKFLDLFAVKGYDGPVVCEPLWPTVDHFKKIGAEAAIRELKEAHLRLLH